MLYIILQNTQKKVFMKKKLDQKTPKKWDDPQSNLPYNNNKKKKILDLH